MIFFERSYGMTITITAFERSPDGGKGLARDTQVRWALEEVGQPYEVRLVTFRALKEPAHLALHPFGQIPTYEEDGLVLFETGSIVLHIAERYSGLLPKLCMKRPSWQLCHWSMSQLARHVWAYWGRLARRWKPPAMKMMSRYRRQRRPIA